LSWMELQGIMLVLVRVTSFVVTSPFFAIRVVPAYVKVGLGVILAFLLFPVIDLSQMPAATGTAGFIVMVIQESLVGMILGFVATLIFTAIRVAGELIDLHIGFSMASLFDPQTGANITLIGQFMYILAILLFLMLDGHHSLLMALAKSFEIIPVAGSVFEKKLAVEIVSFFTAMFLLGFKIAAPIIAVMLISDLSLSFISRTVPQIHVFIIGFPLKAGLGMLVLIIILPLFATVISGIVAQMERDLMQVIRSFL